MDMVKQKPSVMLTERDYFLLKGLYENVVMSIPQISGIYFTGKAKPTVVNRLAKLERSGLIAKYKVPRLMVSGSENIISVVFQITRIGIRSLMKWGPQLELWPEPIRLQPFAIDHDLLLVDVMAALKRQTPGLRIVHGEHHAKQVAHSSLKPDGILFLPGSAKPAALELELTAKSEKRYRELIFKYRLARDFDHVLYVTSHPQIEAKIRSIVGTGEMNSRFRFLKLEDVLKTNPVQNIKNFGTQSPEEGTVAIHE